MVSVPLVIPLAARERGSPGFCCGPAMDPEGDFLRARTFLGLLNNLACFPQDMATCSYRHGEIHPDQQRARVTHLAKVLLLDE